MKQISNEQTKSLRERNRERTRQEIVTCALKLFMGRGFDNVPVEEICESAGVSRATFFNYFPQKELIFAELGHARLEFIRNFLSEHSKGPLSYKFQDIIDLFMAVAEENEREGAMVKYIVSQMMQRPTCIESAIASRKELEKTLIDLLRQMRRQGEPLNPRFKIQEIADLLISIYFATALEWATLPDSLEGSFTTRLRARLKLASEGVLRSK
jgi:AcrR family transcriptional regulator